MRTRAAIQEEIQRLSVRRFSVWQSGGEPGEIARLSGLLTYLYAEKRESSLGMDREEMLRIAKASHRIESELERLSNTDYGPTPEQLRRQAQRDERERLRLEKMRYAPQAVEAV